MRAATRGLSRRVTVAAAAQFVLVAPALAGGINDTIFLHHFDVQNTNPAFAGKPGDADYAAGNPLIYSELPPFSNAPGGAIVASPVKFGPGALQRSAPGVGGRVMFDVAGNFNLPRGTIDFWINSSELSTSSSFWGLWGTQVGGTDPGDIRMYVYNTGGARAFGAYMIGDDGVASRWEIEAPIPAAGLTNNQWHHVAWEWDLSLGLSATFWDGQLLRNTASFGTVHYSGDLGAQFVTRFHIGENQAGSATFPGYIDEFRISDVRRYNGVGFTPPTAPYTLSIAAQWAINNSGNWSDPASWTGGVPNAADATANFGGVITGPRTVTVDVPITVGAVNFDNANAYTVTGANTLTLSTTSGSGAAITLTQGNHAILAPVALAADTTLSGPGTLKLASLGVAAGKSLDVGGQGFVVDYTGASPRAALEALIATGYAGGAGNGPGIRSSLTTSSRAVGIAEAAETSFGASFNGQPLDATSLVVRYTLLGDADLSGTVNIGDFSRVGASFNLPGRWASGDFNLDGTVGIGDFSLLAANFNQSLAPGARAGAVPEPATGLVLAAAAELVAGRRRRCR